MRACAAATTPLLGVCLGHQAIGVAFGATVDRAPELLHGKTSTVYHTNVGVLQGLPDPFTATRYHSLTILPETVPAELEVTARTEGGVIMGVRHVELPIHGVQFHPESILTEGGHRMLANWLGYCGAAPAETLVRRLEDEVRRHVRRRDGGYDANAQRDRASPKLTAVPGAGLWVTTALVRWPLFCTSAPLTSSPVQPSAAQVRLGVGPEHAAQVRHDELVAPGHLQLDRRCPPERSCPAAGLVPTT